MHGFLGKYGLRLNASFLSNPWMGHAFFLLLGIVSVWLYQYRMINLDCSVYTFDLVLTEDFFTPHHRWGAMLPQVLPLGLVKLGVPLKFVLIGYSLSFVLVKYLFWLFAHYVAKQPAVAWAMILLMVVGWRTTYFWPVSEAFQSLIYVLGFLAWIVGAREKPLGVYLLVVPLLVILPLFTHPISVTLLLFAMGYEAFELEWHRWRRFLALGLTFVGSVLLWQAIKPPTNDYEAGLIGGLGEVQSILRGFWSQPGVMQMKVYLTERVPHFVYYNFAVLAGLLLWQKWKKAVLFLGVSLVYGMVVGIVFHAGESELILENVTMPYAMFPSVFLLKDVLPELHFPWLHQVLLIGLGLMMAFRLWGEQNKLEYKQDWHANMFRFSQETGLRQLVMDENRLNESRFGIRWGTAVESTLYSALHGPDATYQIFAAPDPEGFLAKYWDPKAFLFTAYWPMRYPPETKSPYFNFEEGPYTYLHQPLPYPPELPRDTLPEDALDLVYDGRAPFENLNLWRGVDNPLSVKVINRSHLPLNSNTISPEANYLAYHFGDPSTQKVVPVEVNIPPGASYTCHLLVVPEVERGEQVLHLEMHHLLYPNRRLIRRWPVTIR